MALTAQNIIDRAAIILQDMTSVRWPISEMLNWFNDGRRELAVVRPDIYSDMATKALTSGAKQELPADGLRLMDVPRNTSGPAITVTQRGFLDQQNPGWHQMSGSATVKHFMVDERNPRIFWVYPPASSGASVELIYQKAPTDYTVGSTLSPYEELYGGAMVDYIAYRAFSKDSEYAGSAERALAHYGQFLNALKVGRANDLTNSGNLANVGGVPSKQLSVAVG